MQLSRNIINIVKHTLFIELQKQKIDEDVTKLLDNRIFTGNHKIICIQKKYGNNKESSIFLSIFLFFIE